VAVVAVVVVVLAAVEVAAVQQQQQQLHTPPLLWTCLQDGCTHATLPQATLTSSTRPLATPSGRRQPHKGQERCPGPHFRLTRDRGKADIKEPTTATMKKRCAPSLYWPATTQTTVMKVNDTHKHFTSAELKNMRLIQLVGKEYRVVK
jgi:hypothetical protein